MPTPLSDRLALFLLSSLSAQLLANFGQHDVGYADVATGRGGFSLPTIELPTISQHRLSTFVVFPLSRQKFSSFGQHDVGYKGVATGRRASSLCSY